MSYQSDLYQKVILDHSQSPRNFYPLEDSSHKCIGHNPLCGDQFVVYMKVNGELIEDVSFAGSGCAISKSSASLMTSFIKRKTVEEVRQIFDEFHKMILGEFDPNYRENNLGKLKVFLGVREFPSRTKCATLAWHTMIGALDGNKETSTE